VFRFGIFSQEAEVVEWLSNKLERMYAKILVNKYGFVSAAAITNS